MAKYETTGGFIQIHRSIMKHWIWEDPKKLYWWIDILLQCNHTDKKVPIGFEMMECKRGQTLNSLSTWSKRWRVDIGVVRRFLSQLKDDLMIDTVNERKTTRITVCNYDVYNNIKHANESQMNTNNNTNSKSITNSNSKSIYTGYSPESINEFEKFGKWITEHSPRVSEMKEPFTINQFLKLKKEIPAPKFSQLLKDMHNWKPLLRNNTSAYLTILKWAKREQNEKPSATNGVYIQADVPANLKKLN